MTSESIKLLLAALFGLIVGSGGTFAYLIISAQNFTKEQTRSRDDLRKLLSALAKGEGTLTVKKVKDTGKNDAVRPPKGDRAKDPDKPKVG
jgi:hypothetical protein